MKEGDWRGRKRGQRRGGGVLGRALLGLRFEMAMLWDACPLRGGLVEFGVYDDYDDKRF